MSIVTSQQLARYYEQFKSTDVTFNKQVIAATGLVSRSVYLKIQDRQIPCIVFSSSMSSARVIASVSATMIASLTKDNNRVALRWCFKQPDKVEPITFFVTCHPAGFTHYAVQGPDVHFISLEFTQRPPDDLIQIVGTLLEATANAQRRKDERIIINPETMKKLGLETREAALLLGGATIRCVLRDLSFSGAKVVASGNPAAFNGKKASLRIARGEQAGEMTLPGSIRRVEEVGGRKDILAVSIEYDGESPMTYKLLINSYIASARKASQDAQKRAAEQAAAPAGKKDAAPAAEGAPAPLAEGAKTTDPAAGDKTPDG